MVHTILLNLNICVNFNPVLNCKVYIEHIMFTGWVSHNAPKFAGVFLGSFHTKDILLGEDLSSKTFWHEEFLY